MFNLLPQNVETKYSYLNRMEVIFYTIRDRAWEVQQQGIPIFYLLKSVLPVTNILVTRSSTNKVR